jgi:catalase
MVSMLANVHVELAQAVADGLGLREVPPAQPLAMELDAQPAQELEASAGLSLFARPGQIGAVGRRVAVLVADGVDVSALEAVKLALGNAGIVPRWVATRLGQVMSTDGQRVEVETSLEAMPSVLWDAVVVLAAHSTLFAERVNGQFVEFLKDQYRHCKPMLLIGWSADQLADLGLPATLPDGQTDPGLRVTSALEDAALDDFIDAVAQHRHFERETDPPAV